MGRKLSLYLILGLILIGFCIAPVAAVIEIAHMANGDISIICDMSCNSWSYYDNSTGVWTHGRIGEPQSRYIYTPTSVYKLDPVRKYTIPISILIPTPLPTPLSNDGLTKSQISFSIPQFSPFPSFTQNILNNNNNGGCGPVSLYNFRQSSQQTTSPTNETQISPSGLSIFKRYDTLHYVNVTNLL
jgi:hypothetical protein